MIYNHKLIVPLKIGVTKVIYYVKNEDIFEIMHKAYTKSGCGE